MSPAIDPATESLLAFWAQAGVEASYADAPIDRLAEGAARLRAKPAAVQPASVSAPVGARKSPSPDIAVAVEAARAAAQGATDLAALEAAIAAFDLCPLKFEGARQAVFARGDPAAPLMIIGEGPGGDEDAQGAPFVGRAGKLLDRMLSAAGLADRVFITNTVFWRPPGNRTPTPAEQAICAPFVERAISLVKPHLLLLAGGASAKSMMATAEGILSLRGRWMEWTSSDGQQTLPVIATLHPAFLLRQSAAKKKAWGDLLTLAERLDRQARPG
ncbi:MAG: phage polymerase-related protein [Caulobacteraceae bacterium]|nr:phage polymerase-related protein [Caulobacteraceae bacterium]